MKNSPRVPGWFWGWLVALVGLGSLWGCQNTPNTMEPGPRPTSTRAPAVEATSTSSPQIPSPTPTSKPVVFLWVPGGANEEIIQTTQNWLQQNPETRSWSLEAGETLEIPPGSTLMAVLVPEPTDTAFFLDRAQTLPQVPFLVVAPWTDEAPPPANVLVLDPTYTTPRYRAFMAGYLSVVLSPNWRGVMIAPASEAEGPLFQAMVAGGRYYCGLCRPPKPPVLAYPRFQPVASPEDPKAWEQACLAAQGDHDAETVYLVGSSFPESTLCFQSRNMAVIWDGFLPQGAQVAVALRPMTWEEILRQYGPELWKGMGGQVEVLPLIFDVQDASILTPGKLRDVQRVWQRLSDGAILLPGE